MPTNILLAAQFVRTLVDAASGAMQAIELATSEGRDLSPAEMDAIMTRRGDAEAAWARQRAEAHKRTDPS